MTREDAQRLVGMFRRQLRMAWLGFGPYGKTDYPADAFRPAAETEKKLVELLSSRRRKP